MNKSMFELLKEGLEEAISFAKGEIPANVSTYNEDTQEFDLQGLKYISETDIKK